MNKNVLYFSKYCYFCQRVLRHLRDKKHDIELRSTSESKFHQELLRGGGKTQVPCLRIEIESGEQTWMYESNDIIRYIDQNKLAV
jgi:glutathione S-transferase